MVDSIKFCGRTIRSLSIGSGTGSSQSSASSGVKTCRWRRFSGSSIGSIGSNSISADTVDADCPSGKPKKLIRLRNLKHGGTTIRNDSGQFEFFYNPLEIGTNPYNTKSLNKDHGFLIELCIDPMSKDVYLADLCIRGENHLSPSRSSPIFADPSIALVPDRRGSLQSDFGVTISGKIRMVVTNTKNAIYIESHRVKLKCFIHQYVCMVDPDKKENCAGKRTVKLCKDEPHENAHMLPYKDIEVDLLSSDGSRYFSFGTYEFPFSFHLIDFPASTLSYFGKTFYRVESVLRVAKSLNSNPPTFDTVLLTDEVNVKRILSSADMNLKHESVSLQGYWDKYQLTYNVMLNSRLMEMDVPFGVSLGLMKERHSMGKIKHISICLAQSISIPCVNSKTLELLPTTYASRNEVELYQIDVESDAEVLKQNESFQYYEVDNLKIPPNDKKFRCKNWLKPFYCEMNTKFQGRARLKICHTIVIKIKLADDENPGSDDGESSTRQTACLSLKMPVLLVDQDMANNLSLPPYNKDTTPTDLSFIDDPPAYHHGDSIEPPKYWTSDSGS
ncbi:hypothetical protein HG536_0D03920 [Torulaspora globosa]|uniref:Arrestin C-terminal-like domain-containing protein n=1 Tax=Torulaspora globosa TaxID=48254 RepID=A0A7G3ZH84_9SACH|nr:uncharacterized protein HG536_0D03920 [Torulaspora globosa]QLL32870.1 hypothetical protein HG536_0D03920 [Torulaspora globosa]